jgi:hypothetical protein
MGKLGAGIPRGRRGRGSGGCMYGPLCLREAEKNLGPGRQSPYQGDWEWRARLVWGGEREIAGSLFFDAEGFLGEGRGEIVARGENGRFWIWLMRGYDIEVGSCIAYILGEGSVVCPFGDSVARSRRHFEFALCAHTTTSWDDGKGDIVSTT